MSRVSGFSAAVVDCSSIVAGEDVGLPRHGEAHLIVGKVSLVGSVLVVDIHSPRLHSKEHPMSKGISLECGITTQIPQLIGIDRVRQMSLNGTFIDAGTPAAWGRSTKWPPTASSWIGP